MVRSIVAGGHASSFFQSNGSHPSVRGPSEKNPKWWISQNNSYGIQKRRTRAISEGEGPEDRRPTDRLCANPSDSERGRRRNRTYLYYFLWCIVHRWAEKRWDHRNTQWQCIGSQESVFPLLRTNCRLPLQTTRSVGRVGRDLLKGKVTIEIRSIPVNSARQCKMRGLNSSPSI